MSSNPAAPIANFFNTMPLSTTSVLGFDPMSSLIDVGATLLGLPPETANVIKVVAGIATCNPVATWNGISGLVQSVQDTAETEWKPSPYAASSTGYAASAASTSTGTSGASSRADSASSHSSPARPSGASSTRPSTTSSGASRTDAPRTNHQAPAACGPTTRPNDAPSSPATPGTRPDPKLSHVDIEYFQACALLEENFRKAETAGGGWADNQLTWNDISRLANSTAVPRDVANAAAFMLEHPERFNQLEHKSPGAGVALQDLRLAVREGVRRGALQEAGDVGGGVVGPTGSGSGGGSGGGASPVGGGAGGVGGTGSTGGSGGAGAASGEDEIDAIIKDPSISAEEKAELILMNIMNSVDDQMIEVLEKMRKVRKEQAESADDKEKSADLASDMELLQHKLQKLTERRSQMFALLTNMSKVHHESSMLAASNIK